MQEETPTASRIWWFAFGYFACYVPYSALTKASSAGAFSDGAPIPGLTVTPISVAASVVSMVAVLSVLRWWRYARQLRVAGASIPFPTRWTAASGLATATIIVTTTLAYTFEGISILLAMLLMRGGVLMLAPVVDGLTGRRVRWRSWVGSTLALVALVVAFADRASWAITAVAAIDIALYLLAYFVRLRLMSRLAKSGRRRDDIRYFVEEQMVAAPALIVALALFGLIGQGPAAAELAEGFVGLWDSAGLVFALILVGVFSQGTGLFGGLILLEPQENAFCVPVNRSASILAGIVASYALTWLVGAPPPPGSQLVSAGIVIGAIVVLSMPQREAKAASP